MSRSRNNRNTQDFSEMKYSPELIRQFENPEYAEKADAYARTESRRKRSNSKKKKFRNEKTNVKTENSGSSSKKTRKKPEKKKKYKFNVKKLIRNIIIIIVLLIALFTGIFFSLTGGFDKVDTSKSDFAIDSQVAKDLSGYRNIAILGSDARADEGLDGSRTDAIIIMSIKKSTGDVHLISIMRDSYLKMEYMDGSMILDKITHAHHYKGGVNTCAAINRSLDLNIDEFVIFNWKSVADMVNSLGGIEVDVKDDEISDLNHWGPETGRNVGAEYKKITQTGKQTIDGTQAVTYCRIRKTSGGDAGRTGRYKKVVSAVMKKAVTHPWKINSMSKTVFPQIRTNMSQWQLYSLCLGFVRYDLGSNISWPKKYYAGLLSDGVSYVVPTTLESNVKKLHEQAFGQDDYTLSDTASQINQDIINDTGISE